MIVGFKIFINLLDVVCTLVVYITYNMGKRDLPNIYSYIPEGKGIYIRQIPLAHVITCTGYPEEYDPITVFFPPGLFTRNVRGFVPPGMVTRNVRGFVLPGSVQETLVDLSPQGRLQGKLEDLSPQGRLQGTLGDSSPRVGCKDTRVRVWFRV